MELSTIRKQSPIKIIADESYCDEHDAKRLLDLNACDYFNMKLGIIRHIQGRKNYKIAAEQNINIQLGGFLESRLAFTAGAYLSLSSIQIVHCDFDTPLMFEEDAVSEGISYTNAGEIIVPEVSGLGATINESYLKQLVKVVV